MKKCVVIFVEGATDKEFFNKLLQFYRAESSTEMNPAMVYNMEGFGRFQSKAVSKLKNGLKPQIEKSGDVLYAVCCCYDTDVFEFGSTPPIDWNKVKLEVKGLGIKHFVEVKARKMIEDWFLKDVNGLCSFLKIKKPTSEIRGKDGNEKMKKLFKLGNKLYLKGAYCHKFMDNLDISKIRNESKPELKEFEKILNVTIP